jgi:GNAT superfamily N-acetyltransferase
MPPAFSLRPATEADSRACYDVFRRSLFDLLRRQGYRRPDQPDPDLDAQWPAYTPIFSHLAATHAEWWVAERDDGALIGYARSIERAGLVELTEFFVAADARVSGVGRTLLERVFPLGMGTHRSIIATLDAPAVALYLRFGVSHQSTALDVSGAPQPVELPGGYETAPATVEEILAMEEAILGHARRPDVEFMLADRPGVVLRRAGRPVAYALLPSAHGYAGPVGALDPADLPAALAVLEQAAHEAGVESLDLTLPLSARAAVDWLVGERGFRIDPFYVLFLADGPWAQLDRYLPFNPCLML